MKVLKRITLKSVSEYLSDKEMKNVVGGYDDSYGSSYDVEFNPNDYPPSRCNKTECKKASDCGPNAVCVTWSDCPNPTQGRCL